MFRKDFTEREHSDIIFAMEIMGFTGLNKGGMCFGFSVTAAKYYNEGRFAEYDEVIQILSNSLKETHDHFLINEFSIEAFGDYLSALLLDKEDELKQQNKLTISQIFTDVTKYHFRQVNFSSSSLENCTVIPITGIYNIDALHAYLSTLQETVNSIPEQSGIAFLMTSTTHAVMLCAETWNLEFRDDEVMQYRDINVSSKKNILIHNGGELQFLISSLELNNPNSDMLLGTTYLIIPDKNKHLLAYIEQWQNSDIYKQLHELTLEKVTSATANQSSLLLKAAQSGNIELIKQMFDICPDLQNYDLFPKALCSAIIFYQQAVVDYFLQKEIKNLDVIIEMCGVAYVALHLAIIFDNTKAVKAILAQNVNMDIPFSLPIRDFVETAIERNKEKEIKDLFIKKSIDIENPEILIKNLTPLHLAAFRGQTDIVQILLDKNASLTPCEISPDELAKAMGHHEIAAVIREKYTQQLIVELDSTAQQKLSPEALHIVQFLNDQIKKDASLVQCYKTFFIFCDISRHEQSKYFSENSYYKNKVLELYSNLISSNYDQNLQQVLVLEIHELDQRESLILGKQEQINLSSNINQNKMTALKHFELCILGDMKMEQCDAMNQAFDKILNIEAVIENAKKPSKFFAAKPIHSDWIKLLENVYSYFVKPDADYFKINMDLQKLNELLSRSPNFLYESIDKLPTSYTLQANMIKKLEQEMNQPSPK